MPSEIIEQPAPYTKPPFFQNPQVWIIGAGILLLGVIKLAQVCRPKKQLLGRARWANWREKSRLNKKAYKQIHNPDIKHAGIDWHPGQILAFQELGVW